MTRNEWLVPVVLGVLAALTVDLLVGLQDGGDTEGVGTGAVDGGSAAVQHLGMLPFTTATASPASPAMFLTLGADGTSVKVSCNGLETDTTPRPILGPVGILDLDAGCTAMDGDRNVTTIPATRPLVGTDGWNATRATVYLFDAEGLLVASNAPAAMRTDYALYPDFVHLPDATWYLGNGTVPDGMQRLPVFQEETMDLVAGLPEGGVTTRLFVDHPFAWLVGPVVATVHVDAVVSAQ